MSHCAWGRWLDKTVRVILVDRLVLLVHRCVPGRAASSLLATIDARVLCMVAVK